MVVRMYQKLKKEQKKFLETMNSSSQSRPNSKDSIALASKNKNYTIMLKISALICLSMLKKVADFTESHKLIEVLFILSCLPGGV